MKPKSVTKENKDEWITWLEDQLDATNNTIYTQTGKNRVFLTEEDDIDIARYIISSFLETIKENIK